jgi:hypothetical protein
MTLPYAVRVNIDADNSRETYNSLKMKSNEELRGSF